jgi:hypothetical protein
MDTIVKSSLVIHSDASVLTVVDVVQWFDLIGKLHNNSSDHKWHYMLPNLIHPLCSSLFGGKEWNSDKMENNQSLV